MVGKTNLVSITLAMIIVTYQPGRSCTCTNGTRTYTAKDTSGSFTFKVAKKGVWTISDGIETTTVTVTESGRVFNVNLKRIFVMGEGASITGGGTYQHLSGNTFSWGVQLPGHTWQTGYTGWVAQNSKIDLSAYNKLVVEIDAIDAGDWVTQFGINVKDSTGYAIPNFTLKPYAAGNKPEFDISSFNGEYYIGLSARNDRPAFSYPSMTGRIYLV